MQVFKSIAVNHVLTSLEMTGSVWPQFDDCTNEMLTELLWENYTLKNIWIYLSNINRYASFERITERNKLFRKQQRFKTVKAIVAPY